MFPATLQLLSRLAARFPQAREWFDAVRDWYKDAKLSAGVIEQLLRGDNLELLSVRVNGADAAGVSREADGRRLLLRIPAACLRVGDNSLTVGLSDDADQPLAVEAVLLGQPRTHLRRKIDLAALRPDRTPEFQLTGSERAEPRAGCWEVKATGRLDFRFALQGEGKVVVGLDLPEGTRFPQSRRRLVKQDELLKEVGERVDEKLKEWIDEAAGRKGSQARDLADDLQAYAELYDKQIRPAVEGDGSLRSAIDRTANPDQIVAAHLRPVPLAAAVPLVAAPAVPVVMPIVPVVTPVRAAAPRRAKLVDAAPPRPAPRRAARVAKSSGFVGKLVLTLVVAGLSAGAYAAWKNDGLGWVQRQWAGLTRTAGPRGDVLTALRESGTDLGWQPEVCEELPADKLKAFADDFGELAGPRDAWVTDKKVYLAGDRKNAMAEAFLGIPVCDNMIVVHDFGDAAPATRHLDKVPAGYLAGVKRQEEFGVRGETASVTVPNCDAAVRLTTHAGEVRQQQVIARRGRFILQAMCADMSSSDEQERRLAILAKRLGEHFDR